MTPAWRSFFQQFTQLPPAFEPQAIGVSPFLYTASRTGNVVVVGGTITDVLVTRGRDTLSFGTALIIPLSQGDIVSVAYSVAPSSITFVPLGLNL